MITGKTGVFFMIADPIDQVRTPEIFNEVFKRCGLDAVMVPLHVDSLYLADTVRSLFRSKSTRGAVLSIPHKMAAAQLVDRCSVGASIAGAVNAIRLNADGEMEGESFDGYGFVQSMDRYGLAYKGQSILLIGAGGAASAIATALAESHVSRIALFDPDVAKASQLADKVRERYGVATEVRPDNDPAGFDVVINASPMGLKSGDPLPTRPERLSRDARVCDILMKNQPTPLLQAAMARGHAILPGFDMLILQAPLFLDYFGLPAAADLLRRDDSFARDLLFPKELRSLVRQPA